MLLALVALVVLVEHKAQADRTASRTALLEKYLDDKKTEGLCKTARSPGNHLDQPETTNQERFSRSKAGRVQQKTLPSGRVLSPEK